MTDAEPSAEVGHETGVVLVVNPRLGGQVMGHALFGSIVRQTGLAQEMHCSGLLGICGVNV